MVPQRCSRPNPQKWWICYFTWLGGIKVANQQTKDTETILDYLGRPNVITRVLISRKGKEKSQRVDTIRKTQTAIANFEDGRRPWTKGCTWSRRSCERLGNGFGASRKGHSPADISVLTHRISFWISDFSKKEIWVNLSQWIYSNLYSSNRKWIIQTVTGTISALIFFFPLSQPRERAA